MKAIINQSNKVEYNKYIAIYMSRYCTAQNFGRTKLWQIRNCKKIGGEKFWQLITLIIVHYLSS